MTRVLFVGLVPECVDFTDPALPPGFSAEKIRAGMRRHLICVYVEADGLRLPTRRRAYVRRPDRQIDLDPLMASIEISNVHFT